MPPFARPMLFAARPAWRVLRPAAYRALWWPHDSQPAPEWLKRERLKVEKRVVAIRSWSIPLADRAQAADHDVREAGFASKPVIVPLRRHQPSA